MVPFLTFSHPIDQTTSTTFGRYDRRLLKIWTELSYLPCHKHAHGSTVYRPTRLVEKWETRDGSKANIGRLVPLWIQFSKFLGLFPNPSRQSVVLLEIVLKSDPVIFPTTWFHYRLQSARKISIDLQVVVMISEMKLFTLTLMLEKNPGDVGKLAVWSHVEQPSFKKGTEKRDTTMSAKQWNMR